MLGETVRRCYQRRGYILVEHQDIFTVPVDELIKRRSPQYLQAWLNMFHALEILSAKERLRGSVGNTEEDSMATFDTIDLEEYLVDATDGMDREWDIDGDGGAVQTPLRLGSGDLGKGQVGPSHEEAGGKIPTDIWEDDGEDSIKEDSSSSKENKWGILSEWNHGEVELRKRKPPDG